MRVGARGPSSAVLSGDSQMIEANGPTALPVAYLHTTGLAPAARDARGSQPQLRTARAATAEALIWRDTLIR